MKTEAFAQQPGVNVAHTGICPYPMYELADDRLEEQKTLPHSRYMRGHHGLMLGHIGDGQTFGRIHEGAVGGRRSHLKFRESGVRLQFRGAGLLEIDDHDWGLGVITEVLLERYDCFAILVTELGWKPGQRRERANLVEMFAFIRGAAQAAPRPIQTHGLSVVRGAGELLSSKARRIRDPC